MPSKLTPLALTLCLALGSMRGAVAADTSTGKSGTPTPVAGESWLNHLHRPFGDTSMGKTGRLGPPAPEQEGWRAQLGLITSPGQNPTLRGQDLYRLNCQGCHGEAGLGAPPEIHSVIDPVRATSADLMMQRMKQRGMEIGRGAATEMARQAQTALVQRLHNGGSDMPSFSQLSDAEDSALIEYLKQLSGMPGARQASVAEPPVRVGELIVKSTCHVCHDATGPDPTAQQLEDGAIPPLDTLTARVNESQFVRKVTSGAPVVMGTPPTPHRGRMPVFYYLTPAEAADAYLYLSAYRPSPVNAVTPVVAATSQDSGNPAAPPSAPHSPKPSQAAIVPPATTMSDGISDAETTLSLLGLGTLVLGLMCGGLAFCVYELSRLGREGEQETAEHFVCECEDAELEPVELTSAS